MKFEASKFTTKRNVAAVLRMIRPDEAENLLSVMVEIAKTSPYILTLPETFLVRLSRKKLNG